MGIGIRMKLEEEEEEEPSGAVLCFVPSFRNATISLGNYGAKCDVNRPCTADSWLPSPTNV